MIAKLLSAVLALTVVLSLSLPPSLAGEAAPGGDKALATALTLVPAAKDAPKELVLKAGESIVAIGDSITAGGGYLKDIDAVLAQQLPNLKTPKVVNAGVSGQKAEDLVKRFEKDVVGRKPAVVTISIGINDVWHRLNKPPDEAILKTYKENLAKMVDQAQAANIKVILLAPTVIKEDPEAEGNKRLPKYVEAMGQVAAEKKCQFVDLHAMFLEALKKKPADAKGNWLTGDGVHMNAAGNAIMAVGVLRALGVPDEKIAATKL
jgi:acyl-CoA thioesterase I